MLALSLDIGGTHIGCAEVCDQQIAASDSIACEGAEGFAPLLPSIVKMLRGLLQRAVASLADCGGMAFGYPGILDVRTERILSTLKKYEDAMRLNLAAWSLDGLGLTLRMENDARMALLGEQYAGAARGFRDVAMMTLGTGIGGAAMMQDRLLRGTHAQAACLGGHLPVDFRGCLCSYGNIGCAEAEAAGWSLPTIAREWHGFQNSVLAKAAKLDFRMLFSAADGGDRMAIELRERCLAVWASNAVALIHAYDPEVVIIGGGVMRDAAAILPYIQEYVTKHAWAPWGKPQVRSAALGNNAALLGAAPLLSEEF